MEGKIAVEKDYPDGFLKRLPELEEKIGYRFRKRKYLWIALTHSSFSNERKAKTLFEHNERQEFLGDSVLSLVVSRSIFAQNKSFHQGVLTKLRAQIVCADALYDYAEQIGLGAYMLLNHGLEMEGGRYRKNIIADGFEALLAAIYLDGGYEKAEPFVLRFALPRFEALTKGGKVRDEDYKSLLQQKVQTSPGGKAEYFVTAEMGPDHDKLFAVEVRLGSQKIGAGEGKSKREAEQESARNALAEWFGEKSARE